MSSQPIDRAAVELASGATRRGIVRGLSALLGIAGLGFRGDLDQEAAAGKSEKKKQQKKKKKQERREEKREEKKQECDAAGKVCPTPENPCQTVACEKHKCVTSNVQGGKACDGVCIQSDQCCTDNDCPAGEACGPQHACTAAICTTDAQCGPNGCSCTQTNDGRQQVPGTGFCQARTFTQSFANSADGWFAMLDTNNTWFDADEDSTILIENGHAVLKKANAYGGEKTAMSPLGGRTDVFPTGGWDVSLDILLNLENKTAFRRFSYSAAANKTDCAHSQDFIFHVGASGTAVCVAADNNAGPGDIDVCAMATANKVDLTAASRQSGWYRFEQRFRNDAGVLKVQMKVTDLDHGNATVFDRTLAGLDSVSTLGGSRYAFVPFNNYAEGVQIRNSQRVNRD